LTVAFNAKHAIVKEHHNARARASDPKPGAHSYPAKIFQK